MGLVLKFHSVGTSLMRNFDLYFSKRWSFLFPDTCLTLRRLSERYSSNRSQDFASGSPEPFASLRIQQLRVLRDKIHLRYNFHNSHCILVVAFSAILGMVVFFRLSIWCFVNIVVLFVFIELTFGRVPILTRRSRASTSQIVSTRLSKNNARITFALDTSYPRHTSTSCH